MATEAPIEKITVKVRGRDIILDPEKMRFNEATLSDYMKCEYSWYDYFGKQVEFANKELMDAEIDYEALYSDKYIKSKDLGNTENYAKAQALSDVDVIAARKKIAAQKETVGLLKAHVEAWRKSHANAISRGFGVNTEMKVLGENTIYANKDQTWPGLPDEGTCSIDEVFK